MFISSPYLRINKLTDRELKVIGNFPKTDASCITKWIEYFGEGNHTSLSISLPLIYRLHSNAFLCSTPIFNGLSVRSPIFKIRTWLKCYLFRQTLHFWCKEIWICVRQDGHTIFHLMDNNLLFVVPKNNIKGKGFLIKFPRCELTCLCVIKVKRHLPKDIKWDFPWLILIHTLFPWLILHLYANQVIL